MQLYITILGFFITALLAINIRQTNKANIYLIILILINNIYSLAHYATIYSNNKFFVAIMLVHFTPLYMLSGPALFFYVRGVLTDDFKFRKLDFLHFLPAILYTINVSAFLFLGWDAKLDFAQKVILNTSELINVKTLFLPGTFNYIVRPLSGFAYTIVAAIMVYKHQSIIKLSEKQTSLIYTWLKVLIATLFIIYLNFLLFSILSLETLSYTKASTNGFYLLAAIFLGLIILNSSLFFFPNILYGLPQLDYVIHTKSQKEPKEVLTIEEAKKQYKSFEISDEKLLLLKYKVDKYCETKPFLRPEFNLTVMSSDTDIPVHHLSYFFNEYLKINFNTWKNDHKIDHIIELIRNGSNEILTLDALSKQAGFVSRTTFFNAFKQKMGITPSEYLSNTD
jgi:AraC-like DNA-binding protein